MRASLSMFHLGVGGSDISKMISYDYKNNCFKGNYEKGLYIAKFKNPNLINIGSSIKLLYIAENRVSCIYFCDNTISNESNKLYNHYSHYYSQN